ncbi:hypothetical protein, partial [Bacillus cereus group sp. BC329]|uniref:hypothetical protein n=1 Tax=Bacillus cereus group sp. BC329 TaxID=3445307 RepID=UPI003F6A1503
ALIAEEEDSQVQRRLAQALAIYQTEAGQLEGVEALRGSLHPRARVALNRAANGDDLVVADAAREALLSIEQNLKLNRGLETLY